MSSNFLKTPQQAEVDPDLPLKGVRNQSCSCIRTHNLGVSFKQNRLTFIPNVSTEWSSIKHPVVVSVHVPPRCTVYWRNQGSWTDSLLSELPLTGKMLTVSTFNLTCPEFVIFRSWLGCTLMVTHERLHCTYQYLSVEMILTMNLVLKEVSFLALHRVNSQISFFVCLNHASSDFDSISIRIQLRDIARVIYGQLYIIREPLK